MSQHTLPRSPTTNQFIGYRTIEEVEEAFWSKVSKPLEGCWEWQKGKQESGYGQFSSKKFPITSLSHRWAWYFTHGSLPEAEVSHLCNNPSCCRPEHLADQTRLENEQHKTTSGRRPAGKIESPCTKCGGPREGSGKRGDGRVFWFCKPCKSEYLRKYHKLRASR